MLVTSTRTKRTLIVNFPLYINHRDAKYVDDRHVENRPTGMFRNKSQLFIYKTLIGWSFFVNKYYLLS